METLEDSFHRNTFTGKAALRPVQNIFNLFFHFFTVESHQIHGNIGGDIDEEVL